MLPLLYETLYFIENPSTELEQEITNLNSTIKENSQIQYIIALKYKQELLKYYQEEKPSFKKLQEKAKKLSLKREQK